MRPNWLWRREQQSAVSRYSIDYFSFRLLPTIACGQAPAPIGYGVRSGSDNSSDCSREISSSTSFSTWRAEKPAVDVTDGLATRNVKETILQVDQHLLACLRRPGIRLLSFLFPKRLLFAFCFIASYSSYNSYLPLPACHLFSLHLLMQKNSSGSPSKSKVVDE